MYIVHCTCTLYVQLTSHIFLQLPIQIQVIFLPQLLNGKYSFPDDNFMLWRKKKKTNFTVSSRKEIIREMKVKILKLR